jgi:O-antigen/teichoic acid export membrane protein
MAVLIAPLACVLILFGDDILTIWLGNADDARSVAPLARVLIVGTALNGLMNVPHALQLAYGWTKIGSSISVLLVLLFVPTLIALALLFGPLGAAFAWTAINALYVAIAIPLTHRRLLPKEARRWAIEDTALPLAAAAAVALGGRLVLQEPMQTGFAISAIGSLSLVAFAAAVLAAPDIRTRALELVRAN